jgi:hypothetical protein
MSTSLQVALLTFMVVGLLCFVYSWFSLLKMLPDKSFRWRGRISLLALSMISVAVCLRFVIPAFWPAADWSSGIGVGEQVHFADLWTKICVRTCAGALLLALIGRPRFIVPIAVASVATATFWVMSTIP